MPSFLLLVPDFALGAFVAEAFNLAGAAVHAPIFVKSVNLQNQSHAFNAFLTAKVRRQAVGRDVNFSQPVFLKTRPGRLRVPDEADRVVRKLVDFSDHVGLFVVGNVDDPLFGDVLARVPVAPVAELLFVGLVGEDDGADRFDFAGGLVGEDGLVGVFQRNAVELA